MARINSEKEPLSVSQVTAMIRARLEEEFPRVHIEGEISNWRPAASGHVYFALKDEGALLGAVMWKSTRLRLQDEFQDGDRVKARGAISVYDRRGQYQLIVDSLKPAGEGVLWKKFEELKLKLEAEGLFDPSRKREIPALPMSVGVVTSPTGAAIRDVLSILSRRAPGLPVYIWPARVQGEGAAREIANGVRKLAESGLVDVLVTGRGGGSLEDLWEFNDETLARTIAASPVPVISAVGHETDFTICDFVADLRAPTPSAAAELVSRDRIQLRSQVADSLRRLDRTIESWLQSLRRQLDGTMDSHALRQPEMRLREAQQRTDDALRRLDLAVTDGITTARHRTQAATAALQGHNPDLILQKGYAIVTDASSDRVLSRSKGVRSGRQIRTRFVDGAVRSIVTDDDPDLFEGGMD